MLVLIVVQAHIDAIIHDTIITTNPLERRRGRRNVAWFGRRRWSSHIGVVTPEVACPRGRGSCCGCVEHAAAQKRPQSTPEAPSKGEKRHASLIVRSLFFCCNKIQSDTESFLSFFFCVFLSSCQNNEKERSFENQKERVHKNRSAFTKFASRKMTLYS